MKEWAKKFYNSGSWKAARSKYISDRINVDGGLCEECRDAPGFIVHHKIMLTAENINNPEISLNPSRFQYLCKDCHDRKEGHWLDRPSIPLKCEFDCDGEPLPPYRTSPGGSEIP